jgi:STE24 endopeptidase
MMEDRDIEAVFGHEAGHVKHRHIEFYMLFAVVSMMIVGGLTELVMRTPSYKALLHDLTQGHPLDYLQILAMGLIVLIWGIGFGYVSRRFEWQSDLFGARSVTPSAEECDQPCHLHGTATEPMPENASRSHVVCATATRVFAKALQRIAELNGIPMEAHSWRHSSIANRIRLLNRHGNDPGSVAGLQRSVLLIKIGLATATALGLIIAAWLYWPAAWWPRA